MDFLIDGIILSPLKIIEHEKGNIYHIIRNFDEGFVGFGEIYISTINYGSVKAWKKHSKMTCNFVVPVGEIKIVVCDERINSTTYGRINEFTLSIKNYYRLTIPPELWYGFTAINRGLNLMINFANLIHDPKEQVNLEIEKSNINYKW